MLQMLRKEKGEALGGLLRLQADQPPLFRTEVMRSSAESCSTVPLDVVVKRPNTLTQRLTCIEIMMLLDN